jgi:hypothetical protein
MRLSKKRRLSFHALDWAAASRQVTRISLDPQEMLSGRPADQKDGCSLGRQHLQSEAVILNNPSITD